VAILRVACTGVDAFLHALVLSPYFQAFVVDEQTGAGRGGLPKNRMDRIPVAVPPLAEQHRIVAKVDELMALCDQLDASLAQGDTVRRRLLDALIAEALAPSAVESESEPALP
jgi:type I restriction enzyme S subunit